MFDEGMLLRNNTEQTSCSTKLCDACRRRSLPPDSAKAGEKYIKSMQSDDFPAAWTATVELVKDNIRYISDRIDSLDAKVDAKFAKVDENFAKVDENFAEVDKKLRTIVSMNAIMLLFIALALGPKGVETLKSVIALWSSPK